MKIIILHRYFWPQAYPYAQMLKFIAEKLGTVHTVSILTTANQSDDEQLERSKWSLENDIKINSLSLGPEKKARLVKKVVNSIYFGVWIFIKLLTVKTDVVMVATTPPIIIAALVRWASYIKRFKYVYHCQDIHPEAMVFSNNLKKGFLQRLLLKIDIKNINSAWKVITLSSDMEKTLKERGCNTDNVNIINNFIFESKKKNLNTSENNNIRVVKFLFAGSLGRLQNLNILMESIVLLDHRKDIEFTFIGDGVMLNELLTIKKEMKINNISFLGQKSLQDAISEMHNSDIGIVSVAPRIASVAYPSKTMMYLGNYLPVFALVDEGTELFEFINNCNVGKAIAPTSPQIIANSISDFVDNYKKNPISKTHIYSIATKYFSSQNILNKHLNLYTT